MENNNKYNEFTKSLLFWHNLKSEYINGNIFIGVNMRYANRIIMSNSILILLWSLANLIVIPLIVSIFACNLYGIGLGLLFSLIFILIDFFIFGRASVDLDKTFDILMILSGIVILIIIFVLPLEFCIPFILGLLACWLCYFYYFYIGRAIIKKYLFKDYNLFLYFIENSLVRITDKEGKELNFVIKDVQ